MNTPIDKHLDRHGIRKTQIRRSLLRLFLYSHSSFSLQDIQRKIGCDCDRATLYRNLKYFVGKGLLHTVPDNHSARYALSEVKGNGHDDHRHIHFTCNECGNTYCLDLEKTPEIKAQKGYDITSLEIHASGTCEFCSS